MSSPRVPEGTALTTPDEWCKQFSVTVHGPDGWRRDGRPWSDPITEAEFWERVAVSSCEMPARRTDTHRSPEDATPGPLHPEGATEGRFQPSPQTGQHG